MVWSIGILSVASVACLVWAVLAWTQAHHWEVAARVRRLGASDAARALLLEPTAEPFRTRFVLPLLRSAARLLARMLPRETLQRVERRLVLAGRPWRIAAVDFIGIQVVAAAGLGALGLWVVVTAHGRAATGVLLALILALLGAYIPRFVVSARISERRRGALDELPDAADLLVVCVEAGLGFDAALSALVEKTRGVLAEEVGVVLAEMRVGRPRREALQGMADRLAVPEVQAFVNAVVQGDRLGVPIADVLRSQAAFLRQLRRQRVEEASMRVPIKMLFPMVFFILPSLFVIILGPAVVGALATLRGTHL